MSTSSNAITGTWDFKWPQGKKIRVAFQELPEPLRAVLPLEKLIEKFMALAEQWSGANIAFDFAKSRLLPAPALVKNKDGEERYEARSADGGEGPAYDVLVSFTPLPVLLEPEGRAIEITGQVSVLGSYARRAAYGVPTVMLGPNLNFLRPLPTGKVAPLARLADPDVKAELKTYFVSEDYAYIVLHELGHMLGLAHEHQSPKYRAGLASKLKFKTTEKMLTEVFKPLARKLRTEFAPAVLDPEITPAGLKQLDDEVKREIREEWPYMKGPGSAPLGSSADVPFSDWRDYAPGEAPLDLEQYTVMAHPGWSHLLVDEPAIDESTTLGPESKDKPVRLPKADLAQLARMYPRS